MKGSFKNNSIMRKLLIPMMIVLIVQATIFVVTILFGGTIEQINRNSFDILNERVINRKNYIENEMVQRWSKFEDIDERLNKTVSQVLETGGHSISDIKSDQALANAVADAASEDIIYLLRKNYVTGAFLILNSDIVSNNDSGNKANYCSGFYVRDLNPNSNAGDNSDLLGERGIASTFKKAKITTGSDWRHNFEFLLGEGPDSHNFYRKPLEAAFKEKVFYYQDLGYWSKPFRLSEDDLEVITYSVPLKYSDGTIYGVVGVDITLDYLRKMMPTNEIDLDQKGSYVIATGDAESSIFDIVLFNGSIYKKIFGEEKSFSVSPKERAKNIYEINSHTNNETNTYGDVQYFNLYNVNTPFYEEKWALVGLIGEDDLLFFSKKLETMILICFIVSLLIGMIGIFISGTLFTKPIKLLVNKVKNSDPQKTVRLEKINIMEIDELAFAIETLNQNVADASSRVSKIMNMVNLSVGAFEYYFNSDKVYCTDQFFDIWAIEKEFEDSPYISKQYFEELLSSLGGSLKDKNDEVYEIVDAQGNEKWIRIKKTEDEYKILGVVIDATDETLEKKKIEHERDYDILTNLLNRRAFHTKMNYLFVEHKEDIKTAAFLMWDLDSLKYINDTYGHDYGDEYIKLAAENLKAFIPYNAYVSRMSGDEFYVFVFGYDNKEEIRKVIKNVRSIMDNAVLNVVGKNRLKLRASGGIAWYPDDSLDYQQLIKYADFAMYKVKNRVKGDVYEFDFDEYDRDSILLSGREELNRLIEEKAVDYAFQPIVSTKDASIFAYEALMRPRSKSLKSPFDVMRVAQNQSKLYQIEKLTWFQSMEAFCESNALYSTSKIFINSIANHILSVEDIKQFENKYASYLDRIVIELTESEQMSSTFTKEKERWLLRWNADIAIDDFGSGYNSESILLELAPGFVKIDMGIVRGIDKDEGRQQILQNLLVYLKQRKIKVIAEGVETKEEMELLISFGLDYLQGYYFGKGELTPQKLRDEVIQAVLEANR